MPQFNGKQGGQARSAMPNLRCPRNGKWSNRATDSACIYATECSMHLGRRCRSHHQPGYRPIQWLYLVYSYHAHALSGKTVRVYFGSSLLMKTGTLRARLAVLPLALAAAFPGASFAQPLDAVNLQEVVVTATRSASKYEAVLGDIVVLDKQQIQNSTGRTLSELLMRMAGLQMSSNGGLGKQSNVYIRGTENRHILLLVDGIRYGSSTQGTPNLDTIPLEMIERIEDVDVYDIPLTYCITPTRCITFEK